MTPGFQKEGPFPSGAVLTADFSSCTSFLIGEKTFHPVFPEGKRLAGGKRSRLPLFGFLGFFPLFSFLHDRESALLPRIAVWLSDPRL